MSAFSKLQAAAASTTSAIRDGCLTAQGRSGLAFFGAGNATPRNARPHALPHDREFLPAALEVLETPPSPVALALLLLICAGCAATLGWSYFGKIDIHVVAPGKIQPSGRSKVVQPLEAGKVSAVRAENGSRVEAGDVLIELDPTESRADRDAQERDLEAADAEIARRKTAATSAPMYVGNPPAIAFPPSVGPAAARREQGVLNAELSQLLATLRSLKAQLAEKLATKKRLDLQIEGRQKLIALARERVAMRSKLDERGAGSRALTIEALQQLEQQLATNTADQGQLIESAAAAVSLETKMEETVSRFIADQADKQAEMERKRDRLAQELVKASSKSERTRLRSPIAGTVQQMSVLSVGQVVASGQSLMTIVPTDGTLEIEALVANKDVGFIEQNQSVVVKVDAFPFGLYGALHGTVAKISRDAVDQRSAGTLDDSESQTKPRAAETGSAPSTQNLVYPVTVSLDRRNIEVNGKLMPLMPGMAVSIEINTGSRRIIDYLLSPLQETVSSSGHER